MAREPGAGIRRYEAIIATLVGVSALFVSGYTAYVQRQQVRAAVWPILEFNTSNEPVVALTLQNKGVGPAIIRHVIVTVDGEPVLNWHEALQKLLGPGKYHFSESTMSSHVLAAGEVMNIFTPHDEDNNPLTFQKGGDLWTRLNKDRARIGVEICYSSTLGECWTLRSGPSGTSTIETKKCPERSSSTFQQ